MLTTNNKDILFDDFTLINSLRELGQSANPSINYNDCTDNRYTSEFTKDQRTDGDCTSYTLVDNCDCSN